MSSRTTFKGITKRSNELLLSGESENVDYKTSISGLHSEDIISFANSISGGTILIGVKEDRLENGAQVGIPIGCPIGDDKKMQIMSKALSCSPPVLIKVYFENTSGKPFIRIDIPSGNQKPYSTGNGTYKIREDGRNNPLLPEQLLNLYLEREGKLFRERFSQATGNLNVKMEDTLELVNNLEDVVSAKIEQISKSMGWAEYEASNAASTISNVEQLVTEISLDSGNLQKRIRLVLEHLEIDDPVKKEAMEKIVTKLVDEINNDDEVFNKIMAGDAVSMTVSGSSLNELTKEELNSALKEAAARVIANRKSV